MNIQQPLSIHFCRHATTTKEYLNGGDDALHCYPMILNNEMVDLFAPISIWSNDSIPSPLFDSRLLLGDTVFPLAPCPPCLFPTPSRIKKISIPDRWMDNTVYTVYI